MLFLKVYQTIHRKVLGVQSVECKAVCLFVWNTHLQNSVQKFSTKLLAQIGSTKKSTTQQRTAVSEKEGTRAVAMSTLSDVDTETHGHDS